LSADARKALLALLLLVPAQSIATTAFFWWPDTAAGKGIVIFCRLWLVLLPALWLKFVDHGQWSWSSPKHGGFGLAGILGLAIAALIFMAYAVATHLGTLHPQKIADSAARTGLNHLGVYLAGALYWITFNSLMEEYIWRWFVFRKFETLLGGKPAVPAAALAFTAHHVIVLAAQFPWPIAVLGSFGVFIGGTIWSWLYLRYRSVWPCYLSHAIADAAIFIIGYRLIFGGR
jgi:membrane protease YdiL (CAAX protease family)